jgi:hypothetical protein
MGNTTIALWAGPLALNLVSVMWAFAVSPYTSYGDNWAIDPVLAIAVLVVVNHVALIFVSNRKMMPVFYLVLYLPPSVYLWLYCLTIISKDSL